MKSKDSPKPIPLQVKGVSTLVKPEWNDAMARIRSGDQGAAAELYLVFSDGIRFLLSRSLGYEAEHLNDSAHDCFRAVIRAIQAGQVSDAGCLVGFVRTAVRQRITEAKAGETSDNVSENRLVTRERMDIGCRILKSVSSRDRDVLRRIYLLDQPNAKICDEMNLTATEFREIKAGARTHFMNAGRRDQGPD